MVTKEDFEKLENDEIELINNEHLKRAIETIFTQNRRPALNNEQVTDKQIEGMRKEK